MRYIANHHLTTPEHRRRLALRIRETSINKHPEESPLCKCGCCEETQRIPNTFRRRAYIAGHRQRGMKRGLGHYTNTFGYVLLRMPNHPEAYKYGGYVLAHRYALEQKLRRPLEASEQVHHLNGDKADNGPDNLVLFNRSEHGTLHGRPKGIPLSAAHKQALSLHMKRIWRDRKAGLQPMPKHEV